jgi:hypothetical protein
MAIDQTKRRFIMTKIALLLKKAVLTMAVAALGLAALPVPSVYAAGQYDNPTPASDRSQFTDAQLARIWANQQRVYDRQGRILDRAGRIAIRAQQLIDRLKEQGVDTTSLQAALDAFKGGIEETRQVQQSAQEIITSHQGFDSVGQVSNHDQAMQTVKDLGQQLREFRSTLGEPGKALRDALSAFREAHWSAAAPVAP